MDEADYLARCGVLDEPVIPVAVFVEAVFYFAGEFVGFADRRVAVPADEFGYSGVAGKGVDVVDRLFVGGEGAERRAGGCKDLDLVGVGVHGRVSVFGFLWTCEKEGQPEGCPLVVC